MPSECDRDIFIASLFLRDGGESCGATASASSSSCGAEPTAVAAREVSRQSSRVRRRERSFSSLRVRAYGQRSLRFAGFGGGCVWVVAVSGVSCGEVGFAPEIEAILLCLLCFL